MGSISTSIIVSNIYHNINIFNNMNTLILSIAFAHYVACTAWVMYHLTNTVRSLQKDVAHQGKEINKLSSKLGMLNSKLSDDSSSSNSSCGCSGCETNSVTVNTSDTDESSETSSLGPCPSMTVQLPVDNSSYNDPMVHINVMSVRLSQIERDLELYLDKAFMMVGFAPDTGMPLYVTQHDADGNVMIRDAVADYWKSGQMPDFVGEQFSELDGPDGPDSEETELDDL
jgi:hypothetical protein